MKREESVPSGEVDEVTACREERAGAATRLKGLRARRKMTLGNCIVKFLDPGVMWCWKIDSDDGNVVCKSADDNSVV